MNQLLYDKSKLTWKEFKEFCIQKKYQIFIISFFILLAYGLKLFNITISHDTEAIINTPDDLYNSWYGMGRFGLVWLKKILGTFAFNPWVASFMMIIMMLLAAIIWAYIFYAFGDKSYRNGKWNWVFPVLFLTSPILMEQVNFLLQIYEICFLICLLGLILLGIYKAILQKKTLLYIPTVLGLAFCFSCYQAFVTLYVSAVAAVFLLIYEETKFSKSSMGIAINYWTILIKLVVSFLLGLGGYAIGNKILVKLMHLGTNGYLEGMIYWKNHPVKECAKNILEHICRAFTGDGVFYSCFYGIVSIAFIIFMFCRITRGYQQYYLYILAGLFLVFSPFLMTILMGNEPASRTQLNNPFVMAFLAQFFANTLTSYWKKSMRNLTYVFIAFISLFAINQTMLVARICYTEYVQYQEDVQLATKISGRIEQLDAGENPVEPVIFIGSRAARLNKSSIRDTGLMGRSFFELSFNTLHGTCVMKNFMGTLGYIYQDASMEQIEEAKKLAVSMPSWPSSESVQKINGIIIVKLS